MFFKRKYIDKRILICMLLLFAFFKPTYLETVHYAGTLYQAALYASGAAVIWLYWLQRRLPSRFIWLLIAFRGWIVITTVLNHGAVKTASTAFLRIILMAALVDLFARRISPLLQSIMIYLEAGIYINLATLILYPNGMFSRINYSYGLSREWFLGSENVYTTWIVTGLFISWIYGEFYKSRTRTWIMTAACLMTLGLRGASTCVVGCTVFLICIFLPGVRTILTPVRSLISAAVIIILVVGMRIMDFLAPLVVFVLHREMTFTNRIYIWDKVVSEIMKKLWRGHGVMTLYDITALLGRRYANHAHNYALQMLLVGGITALVLAVLVIVVSVMRSSRPCQKENLYIYCVFAIFSILIMGIVEPLDTTYTYMIMTLCYFAREIIGQEAAYPASRRRLRVRGAKVRIFWRGDKNGAADFGHRSGL